MSAIRRLVANAGVQAVVIVVVKIVGDAGLRVGQVGKHGPLAEFEHLRSEAGPEAFSLGIIVALAAAALRAHGLVVVQQLPVGVAAVLAALPGTTAVGVDDKTWGERLGEKTRCKAVATNSSGIVAATCQPTTCLVHLS